MIVYSPIPIMAKFYTLVPLPIGVFDEICPVDRIVWGCIYERWRLSSYNVTGGDDRWCDDWGVFCVYSHAELARDVGVTERTIRRSISTLRKKDLLDWRKAVYMGSSRYYIPDSIAAEMRRLRKDNTTGSETPQSGKIVQPNPEKLSGFNPDKISG